MFYPDMSPYRERNVIYPKVLNVGWLDSIHEYPKGIVSNKLCKKLKQLTLLENYQTSRSALVIHTNHVRYIYSCPLCHSDIALYDKKRNEIMMLGINQIQIPSANKDYLFCAPSLIYHFITEHDYLPPYDFLEAIECFDINTPFNCDKDGGYFNSKIEHA